MQIFIKLIRLTDLYELVDLIFIILSGNSCGIGVFEIL